MEEFSGLHHQLTEVAGVNVQLFQHSLAHGTPDACFPNNWFSTHPAGEGLGGVTDSTLVLYPMKCPNRAAERRPEMIEMLRGRCGRVLDLSVEEQNKKYFEGTGKHRGLGNSYRFWSFCRGVSNCELGTHLMSVFSFLSSASVWAMIQPIDPPTQRNCDCCLAHLRWIDKGFLIAASP